jgi:hypothetical protein
MHKAKIKWLYKIFGSLKEFAKGVTDSTKGKLTKSRLNKKFGLKYEMNVGPPNFCFGAYWYLAHGIDKYKKETDEIGTFVHLYFKAQPLISATFTIDLLDLLVAAAATSAGNPQAKIIFDEVRAWLEEDERTLRTQFYIDLTIDGKIEGDANVEFNTASYEKKLDATLTGTLGATLKAGLEMEGRKVVVGVEVYAKGVMKATGRASCTFGHGVKYDQHGMIYRPQLKFDGMKVSFVIKAEVGISIKRGLLKGDHSKQLVDYERNIDLIPEFDVIKNLETYTGLSANIPIFKSE